MRREEIVEILSEWNFWGKGLDVGIERKFYVNYILRLLKSRINKIVTVFGVRRSGKSFILRQIAKKLSEEFGEKNILYVNFEEVRIPKNLSTLLEIYDAYREIVRPDRKPFLLLDEVQEIKGWERFVRSFHEKNGGRIIVTGSSAKLMGEEFATLLSGRDIAIEVFPLNFPEFLEFRGIKINLSALWSERKRLLSELRIYLKWGGFPEIVLEENERMKIDILKRYFETILVKDVERRFRIREVSKIEFLASFYITNVSSLISYAKISRLLHIPVKTVERFSKHLSTSRMIFFIPRFSFKIKEKELSPRKVYSIDLGLANILGFRLIENIGKYMENLVAINLISRFRPPLSNIFYFKDSQQHEVDFIIKENLKIKQLIQVTYASSLDEIEKRELRSLIKASNLLHCNNLLIITWNLEDEIKFKEKKIKFIPLWKWLLKT